MEKLDKVIAALECCADLDRGCDGCGYNDAGYCEVALMRDALELLKELSGKYRAAVEAAAIATELAAKYRRVDGDLIRREDVDPRNLANPRRLNGEPYTDYERGYNDGVIACYWLTQRAPAVEAEPVVRGKWEYYAGSLPRCPVCGYEYTDYLECKNYCGNCGARMDEEVAE